MPQRNAIKTYTPETFYHVYNRGVNKQPIFYDDSDKSFFLSLLKRYLSPDSPRRRGHPPYVSYAELLDLLAYCIMDNHIHLLIYQKGDPVAISGYMRRVMTSYSMYINKKYDRVGPLFQGRYLAVSIKSNSHLYHISRYIHRNPARWRSYKYTSLRYYTGEAHANWVKPQLIMDLFDGSSEKYLDFITAMDESEEAIPDYFAQT